MFAFSEIYGHEKEISGLRAAVKADKVAHAYLFSGHDGIGKKLIALALAKALNCAGADKPCNECDDCRMADARTHPNIFQIGPVDKDDEPSIDGTIKIAQVRELQNALRYRAQSGKKVAVVEGADRMINAAANAFLKTLEEPPPSSVIILLASKAAELPATIVSRCRRISYRPLPAASIAEYLIKVKGAEPKEAEAASRLSEGSISGAIKYLDAGFLERRSQTLSAFLALKPTDTLGILKLGEELSKRDDLEEVLEYLKTMLRDAVVGLEGRPDLMVDKTHGGLFKTVSGGSKDFIVERLMDSYSLVERTRAEIMPPRYANKQLSMEALLMELTRNLAA